MLQSKTFILAVISKPMQRVNIVPVLMGFVVNDVAEIVSLRVFRLNPTSTIPPIAYSHLSQNFVEYTKLAPSLFL